MKQLHLISHDLCPYVQRAIIVLIEKEIDHRRTYIDLADKPEWFLNLSPLGSVPMLEVEDTILFESQVIAEYLDETTPGSLMPEDPLERAKHKAWIEFASATLMNIASFYSAQNQSDFDKARLNLKEKLDRVIGNVQLPFFSGDRFYLIDGVWATVMRYLVVFDKIDEFDLVQDRHKFADWQEKLLNRDSVKNAVPQDYQEKLIKFLSKKDSVLSNLIE